MRALFLTGLMACTSVVEDPTPTFQFSMAVVADSHLTGRAEPETRLRSAVDWINAQREDRQIELVPILGDIGWNEGLLPSKSILDDLEVPYIAVRGDNEVAAGDEATFQTVFADAMEALSMEVIDWTEREGSVWNPIHEQESHFQTLSFKHRDLEFWVLDWASRADHFVLSEMADRHDFEGGVWPWFEDQLNGLEAGLANRVVMLTHNPMYMGVGGFNVEDFEHVSVATRPHDHAIWANLAGHLHYDDTIELVPEAGFDVHLIDALWDDVMTIQMIDVYRDPNGFSFVRENIDLAE